ncbi:MAG: carbamoyltransferase HypF [Deltaproteobacteria bacterium]|nr:carbamoyltransferase HypF [Deltaproteobacteria bacterium]
MHAQTTAARIRVRGVVQGVGFRPFVYQLALRHGLTGWVSNTSEDVRIQVEGPGPEVHGFIARLRSDSPPLARIEEIRWESAEPQGHVAFRIRESLSEEKRYQRISPDIATCRLCLEEILDPGSRRYRYPFTNCTNCGPRLTIIRDIPYDRPKTTMHPFRMCPDCRREYDDPLDRRFHAQPNCCPRCGPVLELADREGRVIAADDPLALAAESLRTGKILALKGIGGFLLACDATSEKTVQELRQRKRRAFKPLAVMMLGIEEVKGVCSVSREEEALLTSSKSPIVLLRIHRAGAVAPGVSPNLRDLGVMLPYTPLHHLLMREVGIPLVMTSGNLSEEPIVRDNGEALEKLSPIADLFLLHNRDIYARCDDSVTFVEDDQPRVVRRARGYAPDPVILPFDTSQVLACGAEIKNTFCITKDRYAFLSQHIGDMENLETLRHFEIMLDLYSKLYRLEPRIVAHDMHPDYLSTRFARELKQKDDGLLLIPVQHHHAHIVSCMAENGIEPPVLGVAFDGTGYGHDGAIWGSEFLLTDYSGATRLGHIEYVPLPGGDAAVRRPYRMALSYLFSLLDDDSLPQDLPFLRHVKEEEVALIRTQIRKGINSPMTSSAGRLFDAVSALIGIRGRIDYEAQAAVELETAVGDAVHDGRRYPFDIAIQGSQREIRLGGLFTAVLQDLRDRVSRAEISLRFHHTAAAMISDMCRILSRETGIRRVVLSGGVFQNRLLLGLTRTYLRREGLEVITHRDVPTNDGGISLGQAVIGHFKSLG